VCSVGNPRAAILEVVKTNINDVTFFALRYLPLSNLTSVATVIGILIWLYFKKDPDGNIAWE
jgi:uncharacterized RDD family membrane protein YckC